VRRRTSRNVTIDIVRIPCLREEAYICSQTFVDHSRIQQSRFKRAESSVTTAVASSIHASARDDPNI